MNLADRRYGRSPSTTYRSYQYVRYLAGVDDLARNLGGALDLAITRTSDSAHRRVLEDASIRAKNLDLAGHLYGFRGDDLLKGFNDAFGEVIQLRALLMFFRDEDGRELIHALGLAQELVNQLGRLRARAARRAQGVAPLASCLLFAAAFLLPDADRARYSEEYCSEVCDLAKAGAGRIKQMRYALCQLRSAVPTRLSLRSPRRRSAAP